MPKIHKLFEKVPPLRPICSGIGSCTVRPSEFIDCFLKHICQNIPNILRDTTDFIKKLNTCVFTKTHQPYLVTMDVEALYPNIDHSEGISACEFYLEQRKNKTLPTISLLDIHSY